MITASDRLNAALNGFDCDRIPVFCNLLDQGALELGLSIKEYYTKGEYVAEGQLRLREKYGYDNLWSLFYVGREAEILGCKNIIHYKNGPPNIGHMIIKNYKDIENFDISEDIENHPAFEEQLKCLSILKKEAGDKYPICVYVTSSATLPSMLMGTEKWMELFLFGPKTLRDELLYKCSKFFTRETELLKKAGANVILYSNPFASTDFLPINMIEDIILKWMQRDISTVGAEGMVFYCGGSKISNSINLVIDKIGIKAFYFSPLEDLKEGLKIVNGRGLCAGVFNDIKLARQNKDEIRSEVKRIIDSGKGKSKFMFGTMVMPYDIKEENIRIMLEAAYEYGSY